MVATVHTSPMIQLRRLFRFFGNTKAVNDVSFEVLPGQVFGYIGPNGAGKTTSMRILSTLDLPDYGDALVDGFSVVNDPDRVRKRLGFMPDNFGTYPNMNCVEYLDFFARSYGIVGRDRTKALRHTLAYTGLDKIAEKSIRGLSKGMRQRLCLGRAMIHDPSVLILDEPANGLDPRARIELRHMIRGLAAMGKTLLVSSHILTELGEMCDAIGIIERGQLIISGTVADIKAQLRPHIDVLVRLIAKGEDLGLWLADKPGISHIQASDLVVRFQFASDQPQEQAQLLQAIVQASFPVLEYSSESRSLEDVFLQITTGAVQ
ncbi:MAG: ABC transporter ATP-binding protein [Planctomycetales bacterium]|nr:ABC transporter ATP-binding protein [Planctomycetales bacterium]